MLYRWRRAWKAEAIPVGDDFVIYLLVQHGPFGIFFDVLVILAGIDQAFGTVGTVFRRILAGIELRRPGVFEDLHIIDGIAAARHRP